MEIHTYKITIVNLLSIMTGVFCVVFVILFGFGSTNNYYYYYKPIKTMDTLKLVHVIFRHGERTTDPSTIYPNDPHKYEKYYPYGIGQLTKEGRKREYNIGKALRNRYDKFLGKIYEPDILYARSTDVDRTKASLQLVLAGLYPPTEEEKVNDDLNWQPIPYEHIPLKQDKVLAGVQCPNYDKFYKQHVNSKKMRQEFQQYQELFKFLSEKTGWNITNYGDIFYLYFGLRTEQEWGLELPEWSKDIYPEVLEKMVLREYSVATANTPLRSISVGYHLQKILNDTIAKAENILTPENRKIFLYSVHEYNIAYLLATLDVFDFKIPEYGCYIIIELHKIDGQYGIKLFYEDYKGSEPRLLKLPACNEFCPLEQFAALLEEYIPNEALCGIDECNKK